MVHAGIGKIEPVHAGHLGQRDGGVLELGELCLVDRRRGVLLEGHLGHFTQLGVLQDVLVGQAGQVHREGKGDEVGLLALHHDGRTGSQTTEMNKTWAEPVIHRDPHS